MPHSASDRRGTRRGRTAATLALLASLGSLAGCFDQTVGGSGTGITTPTQPTPPPAAPPAGQQLVPPRPVPPTVTISGVATYDHVPATAGGALDYGATLRRPIRNVAIHAVSFDTRSVVASTRTDATGAYSMVVPSLTPIFLRAEAATEDATAGWRVRVLDNVQAGALHVAEGPFFDAGTAASRRDLHAASGWTGTRYGLERAAAPFALLDTAVRTMGYVRAADPALAIADFAVYWSPANRPELDAMGLPDLATGRIGRTLVTAGATPALYVLGAADVDTDEYDPAVVAAAVGRHLLRGVGRDDSPAGAFAPGERLDPRVAFAEGFARAFGGLASGSVRYANSRGPGQAAGTAFDLEGGAVASPGWYSLESLQAALYDLGDGAADAGDAVQLGLAALRDALADVRAGEAPATAHAFAASLATRNVAEAPLIAQVFTRHGMAVQAGDPFGATETNDGGDARHLPLAPLLDPLLPRELCSTAPGGGVGNKLGNRRLARVELPVPATLRVLATGPADATPALAVYGRGVELARTTGGTLDAVGLAAGVYVLEVAEATNLGAGAPRGDTCFTVDVDLL